MASQKTTEPFDEADKKPVLSEEEQAGIVSKLLYTFVSDQFKRGWERFNNKEILLTEDLLALPSDEDPDVCQKVFIEHWELEKERAKALSEQKGIEVQPNFFGALRASQRGLVWTGGTFRFLADCCSVAQPFILRFFILWMGHYVYTPDTTWWEGLVWGGVLGVVQWLFSFFNNASLFYTMKAFSNMRSASAMMLYDKALTLEGDHSFAGDAQQLHNTDIFKFVEMGFFFHQMWSAPLIIVASLVALYFFIGWAGVLSIIVIFLLVPLQGVASKKMFAARASCTKWADGRLGAVNEFLQGIRIVKFMAWEKEFENKVASERANEVEAFSSMYAWRSVVVSLVACVPQLVSFAVLTMAWGMGHEMNAENMFPALAMLNVLRLPLTFLPLAISKYIDTSVSVGRIVKFLNHREKEAYTAPIEDEDTAIEMVNADLQYVTEDGKKENIMEDVNLKIPKGKLTIVCGPTGSGKSTIIHAAVGEGHVSERTKIGINGSIAYVMQEAWIMNATLRDNILMGLRFDHDRYLDTLNGCSLMADLRQLAASDQTEIGERGINLSGGQKQRVAFARAAYSDNNIVLMDDPLSAVDAHVCVALFEDCIQGLLAERTRVLVTHQVQFLPEADHIIVIQDRKVAFEGTFDELQNSDIDVTSLVDASTPGNRTPGGTKKENPDTLGDAAIGPTPASPNPASPSERRERVDEIPEPNKEDKKALMTEELQVQGTVKSDTFFWYYGLKGCLPLTLMVLFFFLWRAATIWADLMVAYWATDRLGDDFEDKDYLMWYSFAIIASIVFIILRQIPFVKAILNAARGSNTEMVRSVLHAPMSFFDTTPTGRIMSRFSKDMEAMDLVIPESLNFFYQLILVLLGAFILMCFAVPYMAIVIVALFTGFYFVFRYYIATNRAQKRLEANNRSPMASIMSETLGGLPTIRAYNMPLTFRAKHANKVALSNRSTYGWRNSQRWLAIRVDTLSALVTASTALIGAGLLTSYDRQDQEDAHPVMALAVSYAVAVAGAVGFITQMTAELEAAFSSIERIKEYSSEIEQEADVTYGTGPDQFPAPAPEWPQNGSVEFDNVSVRYREGLPLVLKNVSIEVKAGDKVGIVGRTGSGKSTIILTLLRMIELAEGAIRIDGQDISKLKMFDLRSKITIIPQDPLLFSGTIRSNLDPFNTATDSFIWAVLDKIGMKERVERDGKGLESPITERGANLSVGQRQLLCLGRALLKRSKVLLLDEATASVDFEADAMIQRLLRSEFSDCTVLTIAHRLATIIDSDKVLVLDHGVMQEFDHPSNLLDRDDSQFRDMVAQLGDEQFKLLADEAKRAYQQKKRD